MLARPPFPPEHLSSCFLAWSCVLETVLGLAGLESGGELGMGSVSLSFAQNVAWPLGVEVYVELFWKVYLL